MPLFEWEYAYNVGYKAYRVWLLGRNRRRIRVVVDFITTPTWSYPDSFITYNPRNPDARCDDDCD
jgi:hypothetical protein